MSLTKTQKILVENILMIVDEEVATWGSEGVKSSDMVIKKGFNRTKARLQHKKYAYSLWPDEADIARLIGREIRRIRAYTNISSESIVEVLDVAYSILKKEDN